MMPEIMVIISVSVSLGQELESLKLSATVTVTCHCVRQVPGPRIVLGVRPGLLPGNFNVATEASNASASDRAVIIGFA